jgi:hypothetical protein
MNDPIPSWQAIRDAEDAKVRASGHAGLCSRARRIMPKLSHEDAAEMRVAMLAGPGCGLRELVLKHFIPLLAILVLLTGCGSSRTQINHGADLAVYVGSTQHMFDRIPAGVYKGDARLNGYYSPADGSITISEQLHGWSLVRTFVHEFGHAFDHQRPSDIWELMARYQAPRFDFNFHPDQSDIERARDAARAATEANP